MNTVPCETEETCPAGMSPFEMLPPEIAEIPIKMVMRGDRNDNHDFLVDVIAKVSARFKALAASKSLWRGLVDIKADTSEKMQQVVQEFLNDATINLTFNGNQDMPTICGGDIVKIATKCPKLKKLTIHYRIKLNSWPTLNSPWTSLKKLIFFYVVVKPDLFRNVKLHHSLPKLEKLDFYPIMYIDSPPFILPNMGSCKFLRSIRLSGDRFMVKHLPSGLKNLDGYANITNVTKASLEEHLEDCYISPKITFVPL